MPVIESAKEVKSYKNWLENADGAGNLAATVIKLAFDQADAAFVSPAFNGSTKARDQVGTLIKYCFTKETDDVDAMILDAFQKALKECLS